MKSDLRQNPKRSMGRYWLTMSDASAFTLVKTSFCLAEALRRDLAEKAQILVHPSAAELTVLLLSAAEAGWGKGKANQFLAQIADLKKQPPTKRAAVYLIVRDAIAKLPLILWTQDKLQARKEFLDELTRQISGAQQEVPLLPTKAEQKEQDWRDSIALRDRSEVGHAQ